MAAAKAGDAAAVATQHDRWYTNTDEIAQFLAKANPAWPLDTMREMMRMHLDQTLAEATARLKADWTADVATSDPPPHPRVADALADGIVQQFPARFTA